MKEFKGKVAVITGSASGIGRAAAERYAQEGMKVVLADVEQKALDKAESEMKAARYTVLAVRTDVSKPEDMQALAKKTIDKFGAVHLLHSNAGVSGGHAVWQTTLDDWKWVMGVDFWGHIYGIEAFLPIMLKQDTDCYIVSTISMAGFMAIPFVSAPYNVSKFGTMALYETLNHELKLMGAKIGVSVLCPGYVNTRIGDTERNRPPELRNDQAWGKKVEAVTYVKMVQKMDREGLAAGMNPKQVADIVFNAIREEKFHIITHPELMGVAQIRMEEILQERNPTSMVTSMLLAGQSGG